MRWHIVGILWFVVALIDRVQAATKHFMQLFLGCRGGVRWRTGMVQLVALVAAFVGGNSVVAAETNPFVGRWQWDGPETCVKGYDLDNVSMQITDRQLLFYENTCTIRAVRRLGEGSVRLKFSCTGEGETERSEMILALLKKSKVSDELLLRIEPKSGFVHGYRRCP